MTDDARLFEVFMDVQRGLPRQGPGDDASTRRALSLCGGLPENCAVLDIGCGPGMQTVALANALRGRITAVDTSQEYLDELEARATACNVADRVDIAVADMNELPFPRSSFDLLWCEGAAYIMGVEQALTQWKELLRPGGCIALTELVWLQTEPAREVAEFFGNEYPAMAHADDLLATTRSAGYELLGHFTLPDSAWWDHYYTPLSAKLPALRAKYEGDDEALAIVGSAAQEIDMRRRFPDAYGYEFVVGQIGGR